MRQSRQALLGRQANHLIVVLRDNLAKKGLIAQTHRGFLAHIRIGVLPPWNKKNPGISWSASCSKGCGKKGRMKQFGRLPASPNHQHRQIAGIHRLRICDA
jgi:hypothetical protein